MITEYTYSDITAAVCNWITNNCENIDNLYINEFPNILKKGTLSTVYIQEENITSADYANTGEFDTTGKIDDGNGDLGIPVCEITLNNGIESTTSLTVITHLNSFITSASFKLTDNTTAVGVINLLNIIALFCKQNFIYITSYFEQNLHLVYKRNSSSKASGIEIFKEDYPIIKKPLEELLKNIVACVRDNSRIEAIQYKFNSKWIKKEYKYKIEVEQNSNYTMTVTNGSTGMPISLGIDEILEGTPITVKVDVVHGALLSKIGGKYLLPLRKTYSNIRWYDSSGKNTITFNLYGNVILTAEVRSEFKTVTFDDGNGFTKSYNEVPLESSWDLPDAFLLFSDTHPTDKWFFEKWNNTYSNKLHFNKGADIPSIMTASWREKTKTIKFYSLDGGSATRTIENIDSSYTLPDPYVLFSKQSTLVTFSSWRGNNGKTYTELTPTFTPGSTTPSELTAYWSSNYTQITLHGNNGNTYKLDVYDKGHGSVNIGNHDSDLNIDTTTYVFSGKWNDIYGNNKANIQINEERPTDLTGEWNPRSSSESLTVSFNSDGGSSVDQRIEPYTYNPSKPDEEHTATIYETSTKSGFDFNGWSKVQGGISYSNEILKYTHATNYVVMKAQWTETQKTWQDWETDVNIAKNGSNVWAGGVTIPSGTEFDLIIRAPSNGDYRNNLRITGVSKGFVVTYGKLYSGGQYVQDWGTIVGAITASGTLFFSSSKPYEGTSGYFIRVVSNGGTAAYCSFIGTKTYRASTNLGGTKIDSGVATSIKSGLTSYMKNHTVVHAGWYSDLPASGIDGKFGVRYKK